ncbi:MAG: ABC transporter substrate-binding protein [Dehalococcoidia bacterium]|nr:ABC transporter substrate-binding protein [Dehalococcoidia bacterium]
MRSDWKRPWPLWPAMTRRQFLGASAAALAGAGIVACDGGGDGSATPAPTGGPTETPKLGGIMKLRQAQPYPSMNPFGAGITSLAQSLFLGFTVFDHMWYVPTDTGLIELFLATSVEQPDAQTVIAKIGKSVYHDKPPVNGRPVVAGDIAKSFLRFRESPPIGYSWLHHVMESIEAPDDETVFIRQKIPWAWVFTSSNAGSPISSSIIPPEIHDDEAFLNRDAIGSGRWMLAGHDNGANVRLRKFPNWRVPGEPYLDGIDFPLIQEDAAALAAFAAQDIDTVGFPTRLDAEDMKNRLGDRITVSSDLSRAYATLMIKYEPPFLDERVRHAINLAIDRDEIIQAIDLGDGVKSGPVPPAHKRYALREDDPDLQEYFRHDPAEARQLLETAGFPFDQEIEFKFAATPTTTQLAEVLIRQLSEVGLKLKPISQDLLTVWLVQTLSQGNFQLTSFVHLPYEDPDLPMRFYLSSQAERRNFMDYKDEEVDRAVLAAAQELDEERRVELCQEAQRVVIRKWAPMLNLYSSISYGAAWNYVKGLVTGRGSYGLFNARAWLDK